jgi:hypothetical protein
MKACSKRYSRVGKGGKVYCPDGTPHLVDEETEGYTTGLYEHLIES